MTGLDTRAIEIDELAEKPSPAVTHQFRVFVSEEAFDRATARGNDEPTREVGGVLVGEVCRDAGGPYIRIDTTIDALHADEQGTELTFTHDTWDHIHKEMDARHQGKRILGWYHTHPGFGVFLSDRDVFIQRSFFNLPYQVALVYDPKRREHGVFVWHDNEPVRARRHWVGEREHIWQGNRPPQASDNPAPERPMAKAEDQPPVPAAAEPDRFSLVLMGVVLLALGGLVGWWLAGRGAREAVKQAQDEVKRERAINALEGGRQLNTELLYLLRKTLGGEAVRAPLSDASAEIAAGLEALGKAPDEAARASALEKIRTGQKQLRAFLEAHGQAQSLLKKLEGESAAGALDTALIARSVQAQSTLLLALTEDLAAVAARAGDKDRARRLYRLLAERLDPKRRELYERKIRELEK